MGDKVSFGAGFDDKAFGGQFQFGNINRLNGGMHQDGADPPGGVDEGLAELGPLAQGTPARMLRRSYQEDKQSEEETEVPTDCPPEGLFQRKVAKPRLSLSGMQSLLLIHYGIGQGKLSSAEGISAVVFMGNTNKGKTEVIQYLANSQSDTHGDGKPKLQRQDSIIFPTPASARGGLGQECFFLDIPQFGGRKALELNLANAVVTASALNSLCTKGNGMKFVVCVTFASIFTRGKGLTDMMEVLLQLCRDRETLASLKDSIVFVIMGAPADNSSWCRIRDAFEEVLGRMLPNIDVTQLIQNLVLSSNLEPLAKILNSCVNISGHRFYPSLEPSDLHQMAGLQKRIEDELVQHLKNGDFERTKRLLEKSVGLAIKFEGNPSVNFLLQDSILEPVKSHYSELKQDFYNFCLPGENFNCDKAKERMGKMEEFQKNLSQININSETQKPLPLLDGSDEDKANLEKHLNDSIQLHQQYLDNKDVREEEVVKSLIEISKKLKRSPVPGLEGAFENVQKDINDLLDAKQQRYNRRLQQYQKEYKEKKHQEEKTAKKLEEQRQKLQQVTFEEVKVPHEHEHTSMMDIEMLMPPGVGSTYAPAQAAVVDEKTKLRKELEETTQMNISERSKLLKKCLQFGERCASKVQGKEMIVVLGNTGAGKSTLINLLCGKPVVQKEKGFEVEGGNEQAVAAIRHGCTSETLFPDVIEDPTEAGRVFCDCPGFFDTRGIEGNLGNAVSLYKSFTVAEKLKVILLIDYYTLTSTEENKENREAAEMFANCIQLFGSEEAFESSFNSILLGVSHAPGDQNKDHVQNRLRTNPHKFLQLHASNFFVNHPLVEGKKAEIDDQLKNLDWIEAKKLKCKVNLCPSDARGLVLIFSKLIEELQGNLHDEDDDCETLKILKNLTEVLPLLKNEYAEQLAGTLKEVVKSELHQLKAQLDASYCHQSFKTSEALMKKVHRVLELVDDEECQKLVKKHSKMREQDDIKKFQESIRQSDADAKKLMKSSNGEIKSLSALFLETSGRKWFHNTNWIVNEEIKEWQGVTCNEKGRVIKIELPDNNLSGMLGDKIFEPFEFLQELDLSGNDIYGELPSSLYELKNLTKVSLKGNKQLCGPEPPENLKHFNCDQTLIGLKAVNLDFSNFGFYVVPKENFDKMNRFITHEAAMEKGMLVLLSATEKFCEWTVKLNKQNIEGQDDTAETESEDEEEKKVKRDQILFLSHRWRGSQAKPPHPDCEKDSKLKQVKALLKMEEFSEVEYLWMDYLCVPQAPDNDSKEKQGRAIQSLPHYVKCCDHFVVLCCDEEIHDEGTFEVYASRGWCRLEQLSAMIPVMNNSKQEIVTKMKQIHTSNLDDPQNELIPIENKGADVDQISPVRGIFFDKNDIFGVISLFPKINANIQDISQDEELKHKSQEIFNDAKQYLDGFPLDVELFKFLDEFNEQDDLLKEDELTEVLQKAAPAVDTTEVLELLKLFHKTCK